MIFQTLYKFSSLLCSNGLSSKHSSPLVSSKFSLMSKKKSQLFVSNSPQSVIPKEISIVCDWLPIFPSTYLGNIYSSQASVESTSVVLCEEEGNNFALGGIWRSLQRLLVAITEGRRGLLALVGKAREAAKHPPIQRTAPPQPKYKYYHYGETLA